MSHAGIQEQTYLFIYLDDSKCKMFFFFIFHFSLQRSRFNKIIIKKKLIAHLCVNVILVASEMFNYMTGDQKR